MTVKDLIELLKRCTADAVLGPEDYPVFTGFHSDYGPYDLSEDDVHVGFVESEGKYGVIIG